MHATREQRSQRSSDTRIPGSCKSLCERAAKREQGKTKAVYSCQGVHVASAPDLRAQRGVVRKQAHRVGSDERGAGALDRGPPSG